METPTLEANAVPSRVESELLAQLQAAFWKKEAMYARFEIARRDIGALQQDAQAAELTLQGLVKVAGNKYGVDFGKDYSLDINTGDITKLTSPQG